MKSKRSFILKASTALVLALIMLFGTVATSVAAVVDRADTGNDEPQYQKMVRYLYIDMRSAGNVLHGIGLYWQISDGGNGAFCSMQLKKLKLVFLNLILMTLEMLHIHIFVKLE